MKYVANIAKAIAAAAAAFGGAFAVAWAPDANGVQSVTVEEWVTIAVAVVVALSVTYAVPNKPLRASDADV